MNRQRRRLCGILLACSLSSGLLGGLLGWLLHGYPTLAALTLVLVILGAVLAWWKWGAMAERVEPLRRLGLRLGRAWTSVDALQWRVLSVLLGVAFTSSLIAIFVLNQSWGATLLNLGTELAGAGVTYLLLEKVIGRKITKDRLIAQMASRVNDRAIAAIEELRKHDWLPEGLPPGVVLIRADLHGAPLGGAQLHEAVLYWAILSECNLSGADLTGAKMDGADLTGACLSAADLSFSSLIKAKVSSEQLAQARSLRGAVLPDGTRLSEENWRAEFEAWRNKEEEQVDDD